ncbi:uncharacterized protein PG998_011299 [Apiospora kogelbergensis]|uniref:Uncharacterized protein n=1 Tax=Apiospora kogelbergensis TaxID=1337665 RepID=A0AAW0RCE4_9PEZI
MSSPTSTMKDIRALERPSMAFLSLAPTTSDNHPTTQKASVDRPAGSRRTSSLGSEKSFAYLKLGPVHWGEHQDDHKDDFHHVE